MRNWIKHKHLDISPLILTKAENAKTGKSEMGRSFVIPDIHGCLKTLKALIEKLELREVDHLYFLGDYIDRGPSSRGVIDYILYLKDQFKVYTLLGNHEDDLFLLLALQNKQLIDRYNNSEKYETLINADYSIDPDYYSFLRGLHSYIELDHYFLVHAGFDFSSDYPFLNTTEMIWTRNWKYDSKKANSKTIIYGHNPYPLKYIKQQMDCGAKKVPLDNGCVFAGEKGFGNLLALELESCELFIQANVEN